MSGVPIKVTEEMKTIFYSAFHSGNVEDAISALKERGFSQMQTVFVLIEELNESFTNANRLVLNSKAWK